MAHGVYIYDTPCIYGRAYVYYCNIYYFVITITITITIIIIIYRHILCCVRECDFVSTRVGH